MNTTNVDNTTTDCPEKYEEHNVSISDVNNVGEGNIMTLTLSIYFIISLLCWSSRRYQ